LLNLELRIYKVDKENRSDWKRWKCFWGIICLSSTKWGNDYD